MTRWCCPTVAGVVLAGAFAASAAEVDAPARPAPKEEFHLFLAFPVPLESLAGPAPFTLDPARPESFVRLAGDPDSVVTLGGPALSGEPRLRFAVEVNEVALKILAPDPTVDAKDTRGRSGADWKPIDAMGRPYQLRLGARLIW